MAAIKLATFLTVVFLLSSCRNTALGFRTDFEYIFTQRNERKSKVSFSAIVPEHFGFQKYGQLRINITVDGEDGARVHVMLFKVHTYEDKIMAHRLESSPTLCLAPSLLRREVDAADGNVIITHDIEDRDRYVLRIFNCLYSPEKVRVYGTAKMTNPKDRFPENSSGFDHKNPMLVPNSQFTLIGIIWCNTTIYDADGCICAHGSCLGDALDASMEICPQTSDYHGTSYSYQTRRCVMHTFILQARRGKWSGVFCRDSYNDGYFYYIYHYTLMLPYGDCPRLHYTAQ